MSNYIFVDVEARGSSPVNGTMTEFGAVHGTSKETYHGVLFEGSPDPENPAIPVVGKRLLSDKEVAEDFANWLRHVCKNDRPVFVSDNVAYDTDTDIGSPGGRYSGGEDFEMKFCDCERGTQLGKLIEQREREARANTRG